MGLKVIGGTVVAAAVAIGALWLLVQVAELAIGAAFWIGAALLAVIAAVVVLGVARGSAA